MRDFFTSKIVFILVSVTIILLLMMAFLTTDRTKITATENVVGTVLAPVQTLVSQGIGSITGIFDYFRNNKMLKDTNEELMTKIDILENEKRVLEDYKTENDRLRGLLDLKDNMSQYNMVGARVIAKDPGNWFNTFTIDKGEGDGLMAKQVVITNGGLVGHIIEVGTNWAKVVSIIDDNNSVGCVVVRTGDIAVIDGDLEIQKDGFCKMSYVSKGSNITVGDLIETSGLGGIYQRGLLIGKVREIRPDTLSMSQYAIVEPAVDFEKISEVMVIKN